MSGEEELQSNVSVASSSPTSNCCVSGGLKEHNYLGLSDSSSSSVGSSTLSGLDDKAAISLKATELTLGLPGSRSPDEKPFFPLVPSKDEVSLKNGNKRAFSDAMDKSESSVYTEKDWMFPQGVVANQSVMKKEVTQNIPKGQGSATTNSSSPPAAKAQIVGWPPVRSYRKNTLATTCKNSDEVDGKPGSATALFVKVSMDGAPYLRKVDLRSYTNYMELSSDLEKMFTTFTLGQCGSNGAAGKDKLCETKLKDLLNGKDYVLTYEDKDGDWMLVGDVPWEMFIDVCKKLKIMKGCDAIGLAPRAMEKSKMRA
ncbi:PREDICTED: auxin-responsive protein IAA9-like isoform X2 [Brassica oleracea var. oleracea]|uniref:auxin-responsive protein IAA9-like isoform X2 n=1 Tax=Brassica oleracea var. oleracea TaxID=109376 RepID=UPI0006A6BA49|nr:PREDICTED: auxin-responsive protein IAA9-like isoform X2 [Brassica oleracea var. oleracea]